MPTFYQDLDGCLADFVRGINTHLQQIIAGTKVIESKSLPGKLAKYLAKYSRDHVLTEQDLTDCKIAKAVMYVICSQQGFFSSLEVFNNGLWNEVQGFDNLVFLTAGVNQHSAPDKLYWVREVLGSQAEVICCNGRREKLKYCNEGDILVDDHPDTINEWNEAGGIGFLWEDNLEAFQTFLDTHRTTELLALEDICQEVNLEIFNAARTGEQFDKTSYQPSEVRSVVYQDEVIQVEFSDGNTFQISS